MAGIQFSGWRAAEDSKTLKEGDTPKSGRVYTMYHGTHLKNADDIIVNGFKPSTGGLLGRGVYTSRNIEKAKCYPLSTDKKEQIVFKLRVNVGKVKMINCDNHPMQKTWHQNGFDCAWIPPKSNVSVIKSGREEDCVWDPTRITIIDVAVCGDNAKKKPLRKLVKQQLHKKSCSLCKTNSFTCWKCSKRICPFEREHVCS